MDRNALVKKLTRKGHSALQALEIAIDVERGNAYAIHWCRLLKIKV